MQCSKEEFLGTVSDHQMTILRDDGVYRHVQFRKPGWGGITGFDFITWPGHLAYAGDMGDFVFQRLDDMFDFFHREPDFRYWAEKVQAMDRDGIYKFSIEVAKESVIMNLDDEQKENTEFMQALEDEVFQSESEDDFLQAMQDFEREGFEFTDVWEYERKEFTFRFEFCCWALWWGVEKYQKSKGASKQLLEAK